MSVSTNFMSMQQEHEIVWSNCLKIIKDHVGEQSFNTWFAPIQPLRLTNKTLTIQVPTQFFYEWLEEHYVYLLRKAIDTEIGLDGQLEYSVTVDTSQRKNQAVRPPLPPPHPNAPGSLEQRYFRRCCYSELRRTIFISQY